MNPYLNFVQQVEEQFKSAAKLPLGGITPRVQKELLPDAPKVLLFSPHPDDECITGLLPLRLMHEAGMRIINVPVTFGNNVNRQSGRAEELKNACGFLGWRIFGRNGFQGLEKEDVVQILKAERPAVIFMPHSKDWNSRHIATHFLVMEALAEMEKDFSCIVIETEFWGAMDHPNLMVEGDAQTVADLVAAISFHVKEVERNPYHLSLPAWMQDNVRRGGELVGGQGNAVPDFSFATLYRLRRWKCGMLFQTLEKGRMLAMNDDLKDIF
ncbi:MAG: PIG-L family deacetylase [Kiritimatiellales bacterium]